MILYEAATPSDYGTILELNEAAIPEVSRIDEAELVKLHDQAALLVVGRAEDAVAGLPDTLRDAFLLGVVEGFDHKEVAELLDITDALQDDLHRMASDLRPAILDQLGLIPSLREYLSGIDRQHRQIVEFIEAIQKRLGQGEKEQDREAMDVFDLLSKSLDTMQNTIARFKLAAYSPDVIIDVPSNSCAFYEFYRATEMITLGRQRAAEDLQAYL